MRHKKVKLIFFSIFSGATHNFSKDDLENNLKSVGKNAVLQRSVVSIDHICIPL